MERTWDGNTRGLGAGSYPEPPDLPEQEDLACEECGWRQGLRKIDGLMLCRVCAGNYLLEHCRDRYWEFLTNNERGLTKRDFALHWWFENLPEEVRGEVAFQAFQREFASSLPQILNLREQEIGGYVKDHADDFLDYIEAENDI